MTTARPRLDAHNLARLPAVVRRPQYDRTETRISVAHIGVGAFHRCHQADYLEDLLSGGLDDQAMVGINLRPPDLSQMLAPQDCLFTRVLVQEDQHDLRVIGCIRKVIDAAAEADAAVAVLADPRVTTVTLTVTEKAYCHSPATGALDGHHPDIVADIAGPNRAARSLPGFLVQGLTARMATGGGPINLVSCDNIPDNGQTLQSVVLAFAAQVRADLTGWIAENVGFPATMVDRIVPATSASTLEEVARVTGCDDRAAVQGETFRQWAISDDFRAPRPRWEAAGAEVVPSVRDHEHIKMRILNAAQTLFALFGCLAGYSFTHEAIRDPVLKEFVTRTLASETLPSLPRVAGMEGRSYLAQSLSRIENRGIAHLNQQIATDTSQKLRQRLLDPLRLARQDHRECSGLACGVAAWIAYLARSAPAFGARWLVSDPAMPRVAAILAARGTDIDGIARDALGMEDIFGTDLARDAAFCAAVALHVRNLLTGPVAAALAAVPRGRAA